MSLLSIYQVCGISGRENSTYYIPCIKSILAQEGNHHCVVCGCLSSQVTKNRLQAEFGPTISYNWIDEKLPGAVTFNHSVQKCINSFGKFDGYVFIDSGCGFLTIDSLRLIEQKLNSGSYGCISTRTNDIDDGYFLNLNIGAYNGDKSAEKEIFKNGDYILPVGKAVNGHTILLSNQLLSYYNKLLPDIFAGWCGESVYSFLCAALKLQWVVIKDVIVHHQQGIDGQSSGFSPQLWQAQGNKGWDHPFRLESLLPIFENDTAKKLGLGYEEAQQIVMHDESQFDENGFCINNELKKYIKDNLFLPPDILDYNTINHTFIR